MINPKPPEQPESTPQSAPEPVGDLLNSPELAKAAGNDDFKRFLDYVPIAIGVSWAVNDEQLIRYANQAFESIAAGPVGEIEPKPWSILNRFTHEDDPSLTLGAAILAGEDFLGTFRGEAGDGRIILVQAYAGLVESEAGEAGGESYRIAALVDVTDRERSQREEFEKKIRDKDLLLKELQHRVKNNLQLITALIRLEARAAQRGDKVDLDRLAGRVDALALLYQALSTDHWGPLVDLGAYLSGIAAAAVRTHAVEGIQLDLKVGYCPVSVNVAMPAGLLINELLTNAFKYAFQGCDRGTITLECHCEDERPYRILVADNGAGFPRGMSWPARGKLGALILQTLRENTTQMNFTLETGPGEGTRATIEFGHLSPKQKAN